MVSKNINNQIPVLPKDWCYYRFGNVAKVLRGGSPRPIQKYITRDINGVNWIKIGDTNINDMYINKTSEKITKSGAKYSRYVNIGDIILSNSMSFGRPYILNINGCIHDGWLVIQDYSETYDKTFLYYALSSNFVKKQYTILASGSGVKNLNKMTVSSIYIITPPKEEQVKIANVLKKVDNLINSYQNLIDKYNHLYHALFQYLFNGANMNRNLLQISVLLDKFIKYQKGNINQIPYSFNGFPVIGGGKKVVYHSSKCNFNHPTVTISASGDAGYVWYHNSPIWASDCHVLYGIQDCFNTKFLYYALTSIQSKLYSKQSGGAQKHVYKSDIIKLCIPNVSLQEQSLIISKLSNIENCIVFYQNKLSKYKQIKSGLMEELLTGKKRL